MSYPISLTALTVLENGALSVDYGQTKSVIKLKDANNVTHNIQDASLRVATSARLDTINTQMSTINDNMEIVATAVNDLDERLETIEEDQLTIDDTKQAIDVNSKVYLNKDANNELSVQVYTPLTEEDVNLTLIGVSATHIYGASNSLSFNNFGNAYFSITYSEGTLYKIKINNREIVPGGSSISITQGTQDAGTPFSVSCAVDGSNSKKIDFTLSGTAGDSIIFKDLPIQFTFTDDVELTASNPLAVTITLSTQTYKLYAKMFDFDTDIDPSCIAAISAASTDLTSEHAHWLSTAYIKPDTYAFETIVKYQDGETVENDDRFLAIFVPISWASEISEDLEQGQPSVDPDSSIPNRPCQELSKLYFHTGLGWANLSFVFFDDNSHNTVTINGETYIIAYAVTDNIDHTQTSFDYIANHKTGTPAIFHSDVKIKSI